MRVRESEPQNKNGVLVDFGAADSRGRVIGASIDTFEADYVPVADGDYYSREVVTPGHYYCFRPWSTRNGVHYGAVQPERIYPTAEARKAAIEKYLVDARKRALAKGRPIAAI